MQSVSVSPPTPAAHPRAAVAWRLSRHAAPHAATPPQTPQLLLRTAEHTSTASGVELERTQMRARTCFAMASCCSRCCVALPASSFFSCRFSMLRAAAQLPGPDTYTHCNETHRARLRSFLPAALISFGVRGYIPSTARIYLWPSNGVSGAPRRSRCANSLLQKRELLAQLGYAKLDCAAPAPSVLSVGDGGSALRHTPARPVRTVHGTS